jgi:heme exporter protein D
VRTALDFSSWQALVSTLLGLALISLVAVGIRLIVMQTVQQRRERQNRQINERLRTLIAAYKTLGGSFTGNLAVDPAHLRDLHPAAGRDGAAALDDAAAGAVAAASPSPALSAAAAERPGAERRRRVRDAVEAALSDVILLGTEEQVRLAAQAAGDLAAGREVETAAIVVSLRNFIREVLDLAPVPAALAIPRQGPLRPSAAAARGAGRGEGGNAARNGGGGGGGGAGGGGGGLGMGTGGLKRDPTDDDESAHP